MIRFIEVTMDDLVFDPEACSQMVTKACAVRNQCSWRVSGLIVEGTTLLVILNESAIDEEPSEYRFAPLGVRDLDVAASEIKSRYYAGFETIGAFVREEELWALFKRI